MTRNYLIWTLLLFISAASVNAVLITPALPAIAHYYSIASNIAQQLITLFLVGYMIGQLIYSPIADRFGRKFALRTGLFVNLIGLILCMIAAPFHLFSLLLIGRFLSALGASAGLVCTFIFINELFKENAKVIISYSVISFTVGAGLAVTIGGFLTDLFGWISCFYFLFFYGLLLLFLSSLLPETLEESNKTIINISNILQGYTTGFSSYHLIGFSIVLSVATTLTYTFAAAAPLIANQFLHLKAAEYGLWNLLNSAGMLLGGVLSAQLVKRFSAILILKNSFAIMFFGIICILIYYVSANYNAPFFFLITGFTFLFSSVVFANAAAFASAAISSRANASAVMNFINMAATLLGVTLMGLLPYNVFLQFLIIVIIYSTMGALLLVYLKME